MGYEKTPDNIRAFIIRNRSTHTVKELAMLTNVSESCIYSIFNRSKVGYKKKYDTGESETGGRPAAVYSNPNWDEYIKNILA